MLRRVPLALSIGFVIAGCVPVAQGIGMMPEVTRSVPNTSITAKPDESIVIVLHPSPGASEKPTNSVSLADGRYSIVRLLGADGKAFGDLAGNEHFVLRFAPGEHELVAASWSDYLHAHPTCVGYARASLAPGRIYVLTVVHGSDVCWSGETSWRSCSSPEDAGSIMVKYACGQIDIVSASSDEVRSLGLYQRVEPNGTTNGLLDSVTNRTRNVFRARSREGRDPRWLAAKSTVRPEGGFRRIDIDARNEGTVIRAER